MMLGKRTINEMKRITVSLDDSEHQRLKLLKNSQRLPSLSYLASKLIRERMDQIEDSAQLTLPITEANNAGKRSNSG
jgi:hypothetical protein